MMLQFDDMMLFVNNDYLHVLYFLLQLYYLNKVLLFNESQYPVLLLQRCTVLYILTCMIIIIIIIMMNMLIIL